MTDLLADYEEDVDIGCYAGLRDDHKVSHCHTCRRLLLARRHGHERPTLYDVTDDDRLPPVVSRKVVVRVGPVNHTVSLCKSCDEDGEVPGVGRRGA